MKKKVILTALFIVLSLPFISAQNNPKKRNPVGHWKFEAPYAPVEYSSGFAVISIEKNRYTLSMTFSDSQYKFKGEKVKFENDSLFFSIYIEGQDIALSLRMEDGTKMSGKAVYSEGEVPLTLIKVSGVVEVKE